MTDDSPVFYQADPQRIAKKIKCGVCTVCEWSQTVPGVCDYGGPFVGYDESRLKLPE